MVVKISHKSLQTECGWMRAIRMDACSDTKVLKLLETYVPTCDAVGTTSRGLWYLAQPMAGPNVLSDKVRDGQHSFSVNEEKKIAAELVAGLYAFHKLGYWHNDLNGENIVLDGTKISLIDLGLVSTFQCRTQRCRGAYSRDGNAVWRWFAELAKCPSNARWSHCSGAWNKPADFGCQKVAQDRALACINNRWKPDEKFMKALGRVFDANAKESLPEQHVIELFDTSFVKKNLPRTDNKYKIPETNWCQTWSQEKLRKKSLAFGVVKPRDLVRGGMWN
jgi:serine/threonine protein kinase